MLPSSLEADPEPGARDDPPVDKQPQPVAPALQRADRHPRRSRADGAGAEALDHPPSSAPPLEPPGEPSGRGSAQLHAPAPVPADDPHLREPRQRTRRNDSV